MKKIILLLCLCATLSAHAQWSSFTLDADELKGTPSVTTHTYTTSDGIFTYANNNQFMISTSNGIFNYENAGSYRGYNVTVGLYDSQHNLTEKITMWLDSPTDRPQDLRTRNAGTMNNPVGQKKKVKKIIEHLETTDGYVRILAPLYGKEDFDLMIPAQKQFSE